MHKSKPSRQAFINMPYGCYLAAAWRTRGRWSMEMRPADDAAFDWRMRRMPSDRPAVDSYVREHESMWLAGRIALDIPWPDVAKSSMPQPTGPFGAGKVLASGWGERNRIPTHDGEAMTRPVLQAAEALDGAVVGAVTVRVLPTWITIRFERDADLESLVSECFPNRGAHRDRDCWRLPFEFAALVEIFLERAAIVHGSAPVR